VSRPQEFKTRNQAASKIGRSGRNDRTRFEEDGRDLMATAKFNISEATHFFAHEAGQRERHTRPGTATAAAHSASIPMPSPAPIADEQQ